MRVYSNLTVKKICSAFIADKSPSVLENIEDLKPLTTNLVAKPPVSFLKDALCCCSLSALRDSWTWIHSPEHNAITFSLHRHLSYVIRTSRALLITPVFSLRLLDGT